ncbi:MAG: MAPEG family protein [Aestuariibacter sp.]
MSASAITLLLYILWTLLLLVSLLAYRSYIVSRGEKAANEFQSDGSDVGEFAQRLTRAHANCIESFPIIAGVLLVSLALGFQHLTDALAYAVLAARVVQSLIHLASTSVLAVQIRFVAFIVQIGISGYWLVLMLLALL